jgi:hypothetical protein
VASDSSSNNSTSSKDNNSIKDNHESLDTKTITTKKRQRSSREGDVLERHCHHSVIGLVQQPHHSIHEV